MSTRLISQNPLTSQSQARELCEFLAELYRKQVEATGSIYYLAEHAKPEFIKHHVNVFLWYSQYFPESGSILDWGCNHAPDSCLIRKVFEERYDLHACDFISESEFDVFRNYAKPQYTLLRNSIELPYEENRFDVVIGSGVLEHTAMDQEALKSLFRVLKPDGLLIISYLPFKWSWDEFYRRRFQKVNFHRRLYGKGETETLLKRWGFYPIEINYQTFVPNVVDGKLPTTLKKLLRPIRYPIFAHSVLCCAARKMTIM